MTQTEAKGTSLEIAWEYLEKIVLKNVFSLDIVVFEYNALNAYSCLGMKLTFQGQQARRMEWVSVLHAILQPGN